MKTITIGDNGHNKRLAAREGHVVLIERKGDVLTVGSTVRVRWRDEFEVEDGGEFAVIGAQPIDRFPQGEWRDFALLMKRAAQ